MRVPAHDTNQPIEKENPGNMKNASITMGKPLQCKFVKLTRYYS
ncbi:hypothetical protein SAMN05660816_06321 [Niastella yeongjuensis]|nr:hypothetical protein SAMN05660816_06321 [Niastella yeongjuensis]